MRSFSLFLKANRLVQNVYFLHGETASILDFNNSYVPSFSSSSFWCWWRPVSQDLLRKRPTVCADGGNWACRVRLPGKMSTLLCARVWFRRQVLREPLRGLPHRLSGEETDLRGAQQRLLLQRSVFLTITLAVEDFLYKAENIGKMKVLETEDLVWL